MSIRLRLTGHQALPRAIRRKAEKVHQATPRGLINAATILKAQAVTMLSLTAHPPGTPTPSSPGQPPSLVSGDLRRSIEATWPTAIDGPLTGGMYTIAVGPTIVYGRIQELGGRAGRGSTLPPRPYMAPALRAAKGDIADAMRDAWASAWT
jgi:phage gpG-like protein